jgi:hypothetical protein
VNPAQDQSSRHWDRSALTDRHREAGERGSRHLPAQWEPRGGGERPVGHEHLDQRGDERTEQHERQRFDDDRGGDHEECLRLVDALEASRGATLAVAAVPNGMLQLARLTRAATLTA